MSIWLPAGFLALAMLHYGFDAGGPAWVLAGFLPIAAGFALHIVVNSVLSASFTEREVGLALALAAAAMARFLLTSLFVSGFADHFFLPVVAGLAGLVAI